MPLSPARRAAFDILRRVEGEGAYASSLLATLDERLRDDDRALCHELVLGVLRRQLWLDCVLEHFAQRRLEKIDLPVRLSLRIGLYQLRYLSRIPAAAAVNESVNLVRAAGLSSAAGFTNAILRRAAREANYDPAKNVSDPIEKLAIETSHPSWLIERWAIALGLADAGVLARANNEPAPGSFRLTAKAIAKDDAAQRIIGELTTAGADVRPSKITPNAWRVVGPRPARFRDLISAGLIYLQDEASQLVAHFLDIQPNDRVLDVCAAPGSKATHMGALAPRAMIVAADIYEHRVRILRELAAIQGRDFFPAVAADATIALPFAPGSFDRVLVDAPCSGTGTLRHNPEIRWRLGPMDLAGLAEKQRLILIRAAEMVRPGGRLLYSTCSLESDENEAVAVGFLTEHSEFDQLRLANRRTSDSAADLATASGAIRTWPHRHDVDGFFMIEFQRRA
ncbi:MAG TPA: 16S rRNA (cytosine(967)-C(5))-methyltransferase RsmB [Pyrinomonadaceae bacterium]|nr:16S rRNA (cytosine(967)-C(5))-methyltransferase RsmB [Pyrinomonadaceae bacterium]